VKRDERLVRLSWDHHHGLVLALRLERELPGADDDAIAALYSDLLAFWAKGLLPHFRAENECLLARLIRHVEPTSEEVRRTQVDHLQMEALVATMRDSRDPGSRRDSLREFGETLRAHIRWEEAVLFAATQERLTSAEMDALAEELEERIPEVAAAPPLRRMPPSG
jgi:hypothetical protein